MLSRKIPQLVWFTSHFVPPCSLSAQLFPEGSGGKKNALVGCSAVATGQHPRVRYREFWAVFQNSLPPCPSNTRQAPEDSGDSWNPQTQSDNTTANSLTPKSPNTSGQQARTLRPSQLDQWRAAHRQASRAEWGIRRKVRRSQRSDRLKGREVTERTPWRARGRGVGKE